MVSLSRVHGHRRQMFRMWEEGRARTRGMWLSDVQDRGGYHIESYIHTLPKYDNTVQVTNPKLTL